MEAMPVEETKKRREFSTSSEAEAAADEVISEERGCLSPADTAEYTKPFSAITINKLMDRLSHEINSSSATTLNPLYVKVRVKAFHTTSVESWLSVDLTDPDPDTAQLSHSPVFSFSHADSVMSKSTNCPKELTDLSCYGCGVWKSKIMIVGGRTRDPCPTMARSLLSGNLCCSDKIYIYDTVEKNWETHRLKHRRGRDPRVVVAEDRVFVFDGNPSLADYYDKLNAISAGEKWSFRQHNGDGHVNASSGFFDKMKIERYSEYFDFKSSGTPTPSDYLPLQNHLPQISSNEIPVFLSSAVYPNKSLILIWVSPRLIVSLDYKSFVWGTYLQLDSMPSPSYNSKFTTKLFKAPFRCRKFAVLEDFLFWTDSKVIYAFNLHELIAFPVHTLPHFKTLLPACAGFLNRPRYTSLIPVGKGMLCLLFNTEHNQICFATFRVIITKDSKEPQYLHLLLDRVGYHTAASSVCIAGAFGISTS